MEQIGCKDWKEFGGGASEGPALLSTDPPGGSTARCFVTICSVNTPFYVLIFHSEKAKKQL